jgi:Na+-driven multidrug efflux pump
MKPPSDQLSYGQILRFWLPLALTWLMMSIEGPFLAAIIARLAAEKLNLAAYGIAFAFALVAESPVIMLMSASTALCRDRESYRRLRNFSLLLSLCVTLLLALFLLPPVFNLIILQLLAMPADVASLTHSALLCLLPWPGAIGIRRFYQGVLIAAHKTRRVAGATFFRLLSMSGGALLLFLYSPFSGAMIGATALSTGVIFEAIFTRFLTRQAIQEILKTESETNNDPLSYRKIWDYYLPLALTPFIALSVHPIVTFFLGKSRDAIESLAVMPVIYGLTFVFRALGLSYQEVAIALIGENRNNYLKIRNFAIGLGITTSACLSLIAFTPLNRFWFQSVSGLSPELAGIAILPLQIMAIFPALTVLICFQRSVLIVIRETKPVSLTTALEAIGIFSVLWLAMVYFSLSGAVAATLAYVIGRLLAVAVLQRSVGPQRHKLTTKGDF